MLNTAIFAINRGDLERQVFRDQVGVRGHLQHLDVAEVIDELREFRGVLKHEILNNELHIHHAALVMLHIKKLRFVGVTVVHTLAHFEHLGLRFPGVSLATEYFDANFFEFVTDISVAGRIAGSR